MWYAAELGLYSYNNVLDVLRLRAKMKPDVQYMVESKFVGFRTRTRPPSVAIVIMVMVVISPMLLQQIKKRQARCWCLYVRGMVSVGT